MYYVRVQEACLQLHMCVYPWRLDTFSMVYLTAHLSFKGLVMNYRDRGLQNGKIAGANLFVSSRQSKTFRPPPPLLKAGNSLCPLHSVWLKLPSYRVKTTQKLSVPPPPHLAWLKLFPPPPLFVGVTVPLPFCSPPAPCN